MRIVSNIIFAACLICAIVALPMAEEDALDAQLKNSYIIKLKDGVNQSHIINKARTASTENNVKYQYKILNAVAGTFTQTFLDELRSELGSGIEYIEKNGKVEILDRQANPPSWGLARVSEKKTYASGDSYLYPKTAGTGVDVYVIDTGVDGTHPDFEGRASTVKSFVANEPATDGHGHGTHCAGTIGSKTYGIAKKAHVYGVKVLNSQGSGTYADVVAGIDFVGTETDKNTNRITIASMSLGGPKSQAVDDAIGNATKKRVFFAVAAGNNYKQDACTLSPAGAPAAFAVGAIDNTDSIADFSNAGKCVKIFAPGVAITSTWKGNGTNTISGTSMATPHVAGVAALILGGNLKLSVSGLANALKTKGISGAVKGLDGNTVNLMLYNGAEAGRE